MKSSKINTLPLMSNHVLSHAFNQIVWMIKTARQAVGALCLVKEQSQASAQHDEARIQCEHAMIGTSVDFYISLMEGWGREAMQTVVPVQGEAVHTVSLEAATLLWQGMRDGSRRAKDLQLDLSIGQGDMHGR